MSFFSWIINDIILNTKIEFEQFYSISKLYPCIIIGILMELFCHFIKYMLYDYGLYYAEHEIDACTPEWLLTNDNKRTKQELKILQKNYPKLFKRMNMNNKDSMPNLNDDEKKLLLTLIDNKNKSKLLKELTLININKNYQNEIMQYYKIKNEKDIKINKFLEGWYKLILMTSIQIFSIYVMVEHNIFWHSINQWRPIPNNYNKLSPTQSSNILKWYYFIGGGYHVNRALAQFNRPKRKDFWALLIHHWATLILIGMSWMIGVHKTGALTMFLHENSDILLETAKLGAYIGNRFCGEFFFGTFVLSWVLFRVILFPRKVIAKSINPTGALYFIAYNAGDHYVANGYAVILISLLCLLYVLHIYWCRIIFIVLINKIKGGIFEDVRSQGGQSNPKLTRETKEE